VLPAGRNVTGQPTGKTAYSRRRQRGLGVRVFLMALVKEWLTPFPRTLGGKIRFESALSNTSRLPDGEWPDTSGSREALIIIQAA